ncbi:DUF5753 domain-containing protein [Actinocorallia sp. B10E7]|uniref:DUF5753 domain-containing protein n=1 Tax=Actinocorallia sp. B10E7 TaxID=3153558 RepID=UPI00325E2B68
MSSPFVRRLRLGAELRALRRRRGLTAEQLSGLFHQSRMKISRLENAQIRPDLAEIMDLLDLLRATDDERAEIIKIAREAAAKGWWDAYGDTMGDRQRLYADIESGAATIREYQPGTMPGLLQTPEYTWALIEHAKAEGPITYVPDRLMEARSKRQQTAFRLDGPTYEVILDEISIRRFSVPPAVMRAQLHHMVESIETHVKLTMRVLPVDIGRVPTLMPRSQTIIFGFPDPSDPPLAMTETLSNDFIHTSPVEVAKHMKRYETVRNAALSEVSSRELLTELADKITDKV